MKRIRGGDASALVVGTFTPSVLLEVTETSDLLAKHGVRVRKAAVRSWAESKP